MRATIICLLLAACGHSNGLGTDAAGSGGVDSDPGTDAGLALPFLPGVNLSGGEFGSAIPGTFDQDYTIPRDADIDYFLGKGMKVLRLPFRWERLQPTLDGELDPALLGHLQAFVSHATGAGGYVLLDPHNYARWSGKVIGSSDAGAATTAQFAGFWAKLAMVFEGNDHVIFGLMNEPHDMDTHLWLTDTNAAIEAIRGAGAGNFVFVPGTSWTGAHSWVSSDNATVMTGVVDPLDRFVFEVHQYFDGDSSGTSDTCTSATAGADRVAAFTAWATDHHVRAFIGEFGAASNQICDQAMDSMLAAVDQHRDVYVGWTYWSAGPWWGTYSYSVEPENAADKPQMAVLLQHL